MSKTSNSKIEKLQTEFSSDSLHHALLFQGEQLQQIEQEALTLIRSILGMEEIKMNTPISFILDRVGR